MCFKKAHEMPLCANNNFSRRTTMTKSRLIVTVLSITLVALAASSRANAQATRTWVSGVGDDANPCSRTAPCKTFAGAISKTAAGGEIDCIDPGGFGVVTITKAITIDGGGTFASILAAGTNGVIINDSATPPTAVVTLRNLSINGAGTGLNGIRVLKAKTVHIENVEIFGFTGNGIDAPMSAVASVGSTMFLDDVDVRNISGASSVGVRLSAPGSFLTHMDHVRIQRVPFGIQAGQNSFIFVRNSLINESVLTSIEVQAFPIKATIENTSVASCVTGLAVGVGATALISQMTITQCSTGISNAGTLLSSGNNRILGNSSDGATPTIVNPK
jgi:hypothetical protein